MKFFTASVALYRALYPTPKINRRRNVKNREVPKFCSAEILYIYSTRPGRQLTECPSARVKPAARHEKPTATQYPGTTLTRRPRPPRGGGQQRENQELTNLLPLRENFFYTHTHTIIISLTHPCHIQKCILFVDAIP